MTPQQIYTGRDRAMGITTGWEGFRAHQNDFKALPVRLHNHLQAVIKVGDVLHVGGGGAFVVKFAGPGLQDAGDLIAIELLGALDADAANAVVRAFLHVEGDIDPLEGEVPRVSVTPAHREPGPGLERPAVGTA